MNQNILYLIIISLTISSSTEPKLIKQDIAYHNGRYHLTFLLGKANYVLYKPINLKSQFLTTVSAFDVLSAREAIYAEVSFDKDLHKGQLLFEDLTVPMTRATIPNFPYYYFPNLSYHPFLNCIGLGYEVNNMNFSLLHKLKDNGHIDRLSFSIISITENNSEQGAVHYGGIPDKLTVGKRKGSCSVSKAQSHWSCTLVSVRFSNKEGAESVYDALKDYAVFQTNDEYIKAPHDFYQLFTDKVLAPLMATGQCFNCDPEFYNLIKCFNTVIGSLPILNFNFDNSFIIQIDLNEMLLCDKAAICDLLLREHKLEEREWVFGTSFLKRFDVLFDMEDSQISFFSNKNNLIGLSNAPPVPLSLCLVCLSSGLTTLGLILNVITLYKAIKLTT